MTAGEGVMRNVRTSWTVAMLGDETCVLCLQKKYNPAQHSKELWERAVVRLVG